MAITSSQRKASETKRKAELGLKPTSYWLTEEGIKLIKNHKINHQLKTDDEALKQMLKML